MASNGSHVPLPKYIAGLDATRAVAALSVLLCHAVRATTTWSPSWVATHDRRTADLIAGLMRDLGAWGVGLFFVVSGFCIHLPAARSAAAGGSMGLALKPYFSRRLRRIYPPHLVALILSILVAAALPLGLYGVHPMISVPTWGQLLAHLGMVHTFVPNAVYSINHVLWSIAVEFHFYLLYPLLLTLRRRYSMSSLCAALFLGSLAIKLGPLCQRE